MKGKIMKRRLIFLTLAVVLMTASMGARDSAQSTEVTVESPSTETATLPPTILGSWDVTMIFSDGSTTKSIFTFAPGTTADAGTVIDIAAGDLSGDTPRPLCSARQGVFELTGEREFATTEKGFCYNASFAWEGTIKMRNKITLGSRGEAIVGEGRAVFTRSDGGFFSLTTYRLRGVRIAVEPLP
jgi:hypothetical protein